MQVAIVVLAVNLFLNKNQLTSFVEKYFLHIGFVATLLAVLVSLTYSIGFGYAPCTLCWWARIFIFPQLIIFGIVWIQKQDVSPLVLVMSLVGVVITGYHTFIDFGGSEIVNCSAGGVSCLQRYVFEFGFVTIPVMALTGFVFLTILAIYKLKQK